MGSGQLTHGVLQWNDLPAVVYAAHPELFQVLTANDASIKMMVMMVMVMIWW